MTVPGGRKGGGVLARLILGVALTINLAMVTGFGTGLAVSAEAATATHPLAGRWEGHWEPASPGDGALQVGLDVYEAQGGRAEAFLIYSGGDREFRRLLVGRLDAEGATFDMTDGQRLHSRLIGPDRLRLTIANSRGEVSAMLRRQGAGAGDGVRTAESGREEAQPEPVDLAGLGLEIALPERLMSPPETVDSAIAEDFAGVWVGRWGNATDAALVIDRVTEEGARIAYAAGSATPGETGYVREHAALDGGVLTLGIGEGRQIRLMRAGPGILEAIYDWRDGTNYATFLRVRAPAVEVPELETEEEAGRKGDAPRLSGLQAPPAVRVDQRFDIRLGYDRGDAASIERACVSFGGEPGCRTRFSVARETPEIIVPMRYLQPGDFTLSAYVEYRTEAGMRRSNTVSTPIRVLEPREPDAGTERPTRKS